MLDLREILPSVRVPTLVLHRASFAEPNALDVAERIRGARAVRVSGTDYGGVVIGSRVASLADGGEVLVSQTVKDLVAGAGLAFMDRGAAQLKGVPGDWRLYAVADG